MADNTIRSIKDYLKSVEEEQKQIEEKEKLLYNVEEKKEDESSPIMEEVVAEESAPEELVEVIEEPKPPEEIDFANDLFEKTEMVLKKYSSAYINQNIENSQLMLEFLQKTMMMLPYNTEFQLRESIDKNIAHYKRLVDTVSSSKAKAENKKILEDYLYDLDKALRRYSKLQIEKDNKKAQYDYNLLLERRNELPEGNPTYEMVVSKRLSEFERRIREVNTDIKAKKECEVIDLHIRNFMKKAEKGSFNELYAEYKQLIEEYRLLEEKLDKNEIVSVKNSLYRCKERLEKIKNKSQKEMRKKHVEEEQKKKEEYLGIRTFWNEYITDLRLFVESLKTANPNQYFTLYEKYTGLLEVFYNLVRNDMISKEESQQATHILEYLEAELEKMRKRI